MAESVNGGTQPPKRELSTEQRLLLAFVLMMVVLFATPYFFKQNAPPPAKKTAATPPPASAVKPPDQPAKPARPAPAAAQQPAAQKPAAPVAAQKEEITVIETDLYRVTFSNHGGVVKSWLLKKFKSDKGQPLELVNSASKVEAPLAFYFKDQKPGVDLNQALFAAKVDPDGLGIAYDFSDGRTVAHKRLKFLKNSYISEVTSEVSEGGRPLEHFLTWRGGFGDMAVANAPSMVVAVHYDLSSGKLVENPPKVAKERPLTAAGQFSFGGVADRYFAAVFLPPGNSMETITFSDTVPTVLEPKEVPFVGSGASDGARNLFQLFVGPKDVDLLRSVNPKLETLVDFGWFAFLAKPLFLIVNWTSDKLSHNYGWAIVLVTIVINMALLPLKISNLRSMKKMQSLQPQIAAINEKYKGIGIRDPRKAEQNQEVMALYKRHGVNPMGGCVPILIQLPFFYRLLQSFHRVGRNARRKLALGLGSFAARAPGDPHPAHRDDREPVPDAENDAANHRRSEPAAHDDVHAADLRLPVLLVPQRAGIILSHQQSGEHGAAMVLQPHDDSC